MSKQITVLPRPKKEEKHTYVFFYMTNDVEPKRMRCQLEAKTYRKAIMLLEKSSQEVGLPVSDIISFTRMDAIDLCD
jgi:hypothetical protein